MPRTHASLPRLFIEPSLGQGEVVALGREQSLYLASVLRKSVGDEVVLFNGRDGAWLARLTSSAKRNVTLEVVEQIAVFRADHHSTSGGDDPARGVRRGQLLEKGGLHVAEGGFAGFGEDGGDRLARPLLDQVGHVDQWIAEPLVQLAPDRGLPAAHETNEHDAFRDVDPFRHGGQRSLSRRYGEP